MRDSKKQNNSQSEYSGKSELLVGEETLISYNKFIVKSFIDFFEIPATNHVSKESEPRTLDFGAGYGALAICWREMTGLPVECLEIDEIQKRELEKRGFVSYNSISQIQSHFRYVYTSNVLEHIENDVQTLKEVSNLLEDSGRIGIYVPAFMCLFSDLDRSVGHYRRYSKRELIRKVESVGLQVIDCRYVDSIGFFASLVIRIFGWRSIGGIGSAGSLSFYDKVVFPISRMIDKVTFGRLLGKNIILLAKKTEQELNPICVVN